MTDKFLESIRKRQAEKRKRFLAAIREQYPYGGKRKKKGVKNEPADSLY